MYDSDGHSESSKYRHENVPKTPLDVQFYSLDSDFEYIFMSEDTSKINNTEQYNEQKIEDIYLTDRKNIIKDFEDSLEYDTDLFCWPTKDLKDDKDQNNTTHKYSIRLVKRIAKRIKDSIRYVPTSKIPIILLQELKQYVGNNKIRNAILMYTLLSEVIDENSETVDCAEYTIMKFIIMATEDESLQGFIGFINRNVVMLPKNTKNIFGKDIRELIDRTIDNDKFKQFNMPSGKYYIISSFLSKIK